MLVCIQGVIDKLYKFQIIKIAHAFCLTRILSTVQQTRVSWAMPVRKTAPWRNSLQEKLWNSMLYSLVFNLEAPIRRFHSVLSQPRQRKSEGIYWPRRQSSQEENGANLTNALRITRYLSNTNTYTPIYIYIYIYRNWMVLGPDNKVTAWSCCTYQNLSLTRHSASQVSLNVSDWIINWF